MEVIGLEKLFTAEEVAAYLHMKPLTIKRKAKRGQINGRKPGKEWLFTEDDIKAFVFVNGNQ